MRYFIPLFLLSVFALGTPRVLSATTLDAVAAVARQGAPELALAEIEEARRKGSDEAPWFDWEALHWTLLAQLKRWPELLQRTENLPPDTPDRVRRLAVWMRAQAAFGLHRNDEARDLLARLLWFGEPDAETARSARHMAIDVLFAADASGDAYRALLRFRQDFGPLRRSEALDFARGLISHGKPADAPALLAPGQDDDFAWYVRLAAGAVTAPQAAERARAALAAGGAGQAGYWALLAEAARMERDAPTLVAALERLVASERDDTPALFQAEPAALWQAYLDYAAAIGNRLELLQGDGDAWLAAATRLEAEDPVAARALLAYLVREGGSAEARKEREVRLASALLGAGMAPVANALFAESGDLVPMLIESMARPPASAADRRVWLELGMLARLRGDFRHAAECELLSADGEEADGARRARILAADSLIRAGLQRDARGQYGRLLESEVRPEWREMFRDFREARP